MSTLPSKPECVELRPCPFCGGEAEFAGYASEPDCYIYCGNDNCFGPRTTAGNFKDAAAQWNTRARDPAQKAQAPVLVDDPNSASGKRLEYRPVSSPQKADRRYGCTVAQSSRDDLGLVLAALREFEEATGETYDDDEGVISEIERDHKASRPRSQEVTTKGGGA